MVVTQKSENFRTNLALVTHGRKCIPKNFLLFIYLFIYFTFFSLGSEKLFSGHTQNFSLNFFHSTCTAPPMTTVIFQHYC